MSLRKREFAVLGALLLMAFPSTGQTKKYDIKSGVVTFTSTTISGSLKISDKVVVYFDDFGMRECRETFEGSKLKESFFSDGKTLYTLIHAKKEAYKRGDASRGTELRFDWGEVSARDKQEGKAKQLPPQKIAGKSCEVFSIAGGSMTTTYGGWGHICLMTDVKWSKMGSSVVATKLEENVPVPKEKFEVPPGYTLK